MKKVITHLSILIFVVSVWKCSTKQRDDRECNVLKSQKTVENATFAIHPSNPRYFIWKNKPTVLITCSEHYGSVINLDFNYNIYLDTLRANGFNLTRTFTGSYVEGEKSIPWINEHGLAPLPNRLIVPWARSQVKEYINGGNKFDLNVWDSLYFNRIKDFLKAANERDIIVEVVLFSQMYNEYNWSFSPFNAKNNVNNIPELTWDKFNTMACNELIKYQDAFVEKLVTELNDFDNFYFEICNEPNFQKVGVERNAEWARHHLNTIVETEEKLTKKHLVAFQDAYVMTDPRLSLYNFHYGFGETWTGALEGIKEYHNLNKALGFNETFDVGQGNTLDGLRSEGWRFLLSGGAIFNNLTWAFIPGDEGDKNNKSMETRRQLQVLKRFMDSIPFVEMESCDTAFVSHNNKIEVYALSSPTGNYAIYLLGGRLADLKLKVPEGNYLIEWIDPKNGKVIKRDNLTVTNRTNQIQSPEYIVDIAVKIDKVIQ